MRKTIGAFTATGSDIYNTQNAENVTFQFVATGIVSGNGVLTVLGSNDGVNYSAISFVNPAPSNTNQQTLIRLTSLTLSSAGTSSALGVIENHAKFEFLKFVVTVTTDGSYSVYIHADNKVS